MPTKDDRIDVYISKSQDFAKPILNYLRSLIHKNCPDVVETMKWSFPHFVYKGSILCSMASFKQHCAFGFWLATKMRDKEGIFNTAEKTGMGHLGQIKSLKDLPSEKILSAYIKEAMDLTDKGVKLQKKDIITSTDIEVPAYFSTALKKNKAALKNFENFSPSHKKEYIQWITEAKTEETKNKRMDTALEWLAEGKARNWKYMNSKTKAI